MQTKRASPKVLPIRPLCAEHCFSGLQEDRRRRKLRMVMAISEDEISKAEELERPKKGF